MYGNLDVFSISFGYFPDCPTSGAQKIHHVRKKRFSGHTIVNLIPNLNHSDIYTGIGVPEGKKSVAFRLTLRADDRSLTAEEADADVKSILAALESELDARLR